MNTSSDFFGGIITVAIVIVFAKFVTHHNRHSLRTKSSYGWHLASVGLSALAVAMGLVGAELETDPDPWFHLVAAAAMAAGVVILLVDVLADDWRRLTELEVRETSSSHTRRTGGAGAGRPGGPPAGS